MKASKDMRDETRVDGTESRGPTLLQISAGLGPGPSTSTREARTDLNIVHVSQNDM